MRIIRSSVLLVALFGLISIAHAQQSIAPQQAVKFIGRQMTVCGPVVSAYYCSPIQWAAYNPKSR